MRRLPDGLRHLALSTLLFGGVWPVTKHAFDAGASALWFATARAGFAVVASALLLAALRRLRLPPRGDLAAAVVIGLGQLGGFFALTHLALERLPAGRTAILGNVTIVWVVPLSVWLLHDRVSRAQWVAVALGLAGVAILAEPWRAEAASATGYALLLGASLAWSLSIVFVRARPPRRPILELLPWCFLVATLLLLPLALFRAPGGGLGGGWAHALFIGALAAPIGTWATIEAGRRLSGALASIGFLMIPTVGVLLATLWLGEPVGWTLLAGGGLILGAVVLAARG